MPIHHQFLRVNVSTIEEGPAVLLNPHSYILLKLRSISLISCSIVWYAKAKQCWFSVHLLFSCHIFINRWVCWALSASLRSGDWAGRWNLGVQADRSEYLIAYWMVFRLQSAYFTLLFYFTVPIDLLDAVKEFGLGICTCICCCLWQHVSLAKT